ncbi:MAG: TIGR00730 family Rossman fold protein [Chloroflexota bacterium]|nr:TIGR00730 family Rossman fold protein [Chloroflexota bacterium]
MTRPFSVAVYCSASDRVDRAYFEVATELGAAMGTRGWRLVYGAGSVGLMGAVARATHAAGGQVLGVIPHALDRLEVTFEECTELIRVETMRQRKALMEENSDAFIALPGGFGTLEEIIEIIVLKQLHYIDRPIVFLDVLGYWQPLLALFDEMIEQRFATPTHANLYKSVATPQEALDYIGNYYPTEAEAPWETVQEDEELRTALE